MQQPTQKALVTGGKPLDSVFKALKKTDAQKAYFHSLLVNVIAIDMSAFSMVDNAGFVDLCTAFGYAVPSR